jgi:hypothetical protein
MTDWYIDQMKTKTYESDPCQFLLRMMSMWDKLDYVVNIPKQIADGILVILWPLLKIQNLLFRCKMDKRSIFTNKVRIPWIKTRSSKNKVVGSQYFDLIVPYIDIDIKEK